MTRVSDHFNLQRTQATLEFVDVDVVDDVPLFIDPGAIRLLGTTMAQECSSLLQNFFNHVLDAIQSGDDDQAIALLATLSELRETRLGLSAAGSGGHGMGDGLAEAIHARLQTSRAVQSGLLHDLEETALFVRGVDRDVISDIVTNITFGPLVKFTQTMCAKYDIPTVPGVAFYHWDRRLGWTQGEAGLPIVSDLPLVLVPRSFVRRRRNILHPDGYYRHHIVPFLQHQHFRADAGLVRILRNGSARPPYKKTIMAMYPNVKETNTDITTEHPELLQQYREEAKKEFGPIGHQDLAAATSSAEPDFAALLADVVACRPGDEHAARYQRAVEKLLTALLYPALDSPSLEQPMDGGRKRIDIDYTNIANRGFFFWIHAVHGTAASYVAVECKNYSKDPKNPEFDQLSGRFTIQRGSLGLLVYRTSLNKALIIQRCKDAAIGGRGYMLPIDDADLANLVAERVGLIDGQDFRLLHQRFKEIVT